MDITRFLERKTELLKAEQVYQFIRDNGLPLFEQLTATVVTWQPTQH